MLLNSRITFLVIAVIGALAFWQVPHAAAEGGNERMNVELFYGTIATPTFRNIPWDGKHTVPLHKLLVAKDGMVYDIALTNVSVLVYNPQRPLPQGGNK
jgi:hypothetical protein